MSFYKIAKCLSASFIGLNIKPTSTLKFGDELNLTSGGSIRIELRI